MQMQWAALMVQMTDATILLIHVILLFQAKCIHFKDRHRREENIEDTPSFTVGPHFYAGNKS